MHTHSFLPSGNFFEVDAHPQLQINRPLFAFVPNSLIEKGGVNEKKYVESKWAAINCAANLQSSLGSHVFPDLLKPVDISKIPKSFLEGLNLYAHKSLGKNSPIRKPGINEPSFP